jgi:hypothetical protein
VRPYQFPAPYNHQWQPHRAHMVKSAFTVEPSTFTSNARPEWQRFFDDGSQAYYWLNNVTGESRWE